VNLLGKLGELNLSFPVSLEVIALFPLSTVPVQQV
jgi:hypothetical protein